MREYKPSFFTKLRQLEQLNRELNISDSVLPLYRDFMSFVENGNFTDSEPVKYVCSNWKLKPREISDKWNSSNAKKKSYNTWGVQVKFTSELLESIFPNFEPMIFHKTNDTDVKANEKRNIISLTIKSIDTPNLYPSDMFIEEINKLNTGNETEYNIEDCEEELKVLKLLSQDNINNILSKVDKNKLSYILGVLSQKSSVYKNKEFNKNKLLVLQKLNKVNTDFNEYKQDEVIVKEKIIYKEVKEEQPYKLGITKEMADILTKRLNTQATEKELTLTPDTKGYKESLEKLVEFMYFMTPEGFEYNLNKINVLLLDSIVRGNYHDFTTRIVNTNEKGFLK